MFSGGRVILWLAILIRHLAVVAYTSVVASDREYRLCLGDLRAHWMARP